MFASFVCSSKQSIQTWNDVIVQNDAVVQYQYLLQQPRVYEVVKMTC
jgi:hypothetical protein